MRFLPIGVRTHTYTALYTAQRVGLRWLFTPPFHRFAVRQHRSSAALGLYVMPYPLGQGTAALTGNTNASNR